MPDSEELASDNSSQQLDSSKKSSSSQVPEMMIINSWLTVVKDPQNDGDSSSAYLNKEILLSLKLHAGDIIRLTGRKQSLFIAWPSNRIDANCIGLDRIARDNLIVRLGSRIQIALAEDYQDLRRASVIPFADTIMHLPHPTNLFEIYLRPYFTNTYRPLSAGDRFKCGPEGRSVEFQVVALDPVEGGIVSTKTVVRCEGRPLTRPRSFPVWEDVGGYSVEIASLKQAVDTCIHSTQNSGYHHRGILICGPSGCGKTLIIEALLMERLEHRGYIFYLKAVEMEGSSYSPEESVRNAFCQASQHILSIIILDDIDEMMKISGQVLPQLLFQMDKYRSTMVICTACNSQMVPPELQKHGRLSRRIEIGLPTINDRMEILKICLREEPFEAPNSEEMWKHFADLTDGFTGNDISEMCIEGKGIFLHEPGEYGDLSRFTWGHLSKAWGYLSERVKARQALKTPTIKGNINLNSLAATLPAIRSKNDYSIACIFPMGVEFTAGLAMLDEKHENLPLSRDHNVYTLGRIAHHLVILVAMPETGNSSAARVATQLVNDFSSIRFALVVGIGGGTPSRKHDIRLGDVVVSKPTGTFGGVVQYDLGKIHQDQSFERTGTLNKPGPLLQGTIQKLSAINDIEGSNISSILSTAFELHPRMKAKFSFPSTAKDVLFQSSYLHEGASNTDCGNCAMDKTVSRTPRPDTEPYVHYGTIGSANVVLKNAHLRDELQEDMDLLCVEMEAAGLMDEFPCLVVRGICDYADSHKNEEWQPYSAMTAAAYMREFLLQIPARQVLDVPSAFDKINKG